jgi:4-carboxymuconolactone decarboxylase
MTQHIHLAAIVIREGQLMLIRPQIGAPWELPGGPFLDEHEDMDVAMDALLTAFGINTPAIEEDFIETIFLPAADGQLIYNLYAPSEWAGEPFAPSGAGVGWYGLDELGAVNMDARVRSGVLRAFGLEGEADPAEILSAMQAEFGFGEAKPASEPTPEPETGVPQEPTEPEPEPVIGASLTSTDPFLEPVATAPAPEPIITLSPDLPVEDEEGPSITAPVSRREAGLDVLRTLSGDDPLAEELLRTGTGDLADAILDFSMGEIWQSPALDRRIRSLEVVAMLAATGKLGSLKSHIGGALNHGATPDELVETIKMVSVYAGFPAAVEAWRVLAEVFDERGITKEVDP